MAKKYELIRKDNEGKEHLVAKFEREGDAIWACTCFQANKGFINYFHFVRQGKRTFYSSIVISALQFNIVD